MLCWDERSNPIFIGKEHPRKCFPLYSWGLPCAVSVPLLTDPTTSPVSWQKASHGSPHWG